MCCHLLNNRTHPAPAQPAGHASHVAKSLKSLSGVAVQVPRVQERLATVTARHEAAAALREARRTLAAHQAAAAELSGSRTFAAALGLALAAGNFLNHGTRLGGAAAFRLRSLARLQVRAPTLQETLTCFLAAHRACYRGTRRACRCGP